MRYGEPQKTGYHSNINAYGGGRMGYDVMVLFQTSQFLPLFLLTYADSRLNTRIDDTFNSTIASKMNENDRKSRKIKTTSNKINQNSNQEIDDEPGLALLPIPSMEEFI